MIPHNIKEFLHQIELTDQKHYFLLYKFYLNPSLSLGGNQKSTLKNYNNYGDIKYLILNNVFCAFLKLCLQETEFTQKLDNILLIKIRYLLLDSKECTKNYCPELYDPKIQYLITHHNTFKNINQIQISKNLTYLKKVYTKIGFIYRLRIKPKQIKSLNVTLVDNLLDMITDLEINYYETHIAPNLEKKTILEKIKNDNYSSEHNCYLYARHGKDQQSFQALVCDNNFLEIVKNNLLPQPLPSIIIENIIELLEISLNIKLINPYSKKNLAIGQSLDPQKVKNFHHQEAIDLIEKLDQKLYNPKVTNFKRKIKRPQQHY